jgi:hypothetical protein
MLYRAEDDGDKCLNELLNVKAEMALIESEYEELEAIENPIVEVVNKCNELDIRYSYLIEKKEELMEKLEEISERLIDEISNNQND